MNYKLVILGIVLVAAVIFAFWFWGQFTFNQDELSNLPVDTGSQNTEPNIPASQAPSAESAGSLEAELNTMDLEGLDSEELDLTGL